MGQRRKRVIGVMGGGSADAASEQMAEDLGRGIAEAGWALLTGGRPAGVMLAASRGACEAGGLVIGVLPDASPQAANDFVHIAIATGLGDARNLVNVLSADVVVACAGGAGTQSEVALALKNGRSVIGLGFDPGPYIAPYEATGQFVHAVDPSQAIVQIRHRLG
jgi:uncharacterized protein (TIGR00725 family)